MLQTARFYARLYYHVQTRAHNLLRQKVITDWVSAIVSYILTESLKDDYLILSCTLFNDNDTINAYSMIDCDAFRKAFIDFFFAQFHKIPLLFLH